MGLEGFDGKFSPSRAKGEIVFEKVIVSVDVSHGKNLQGQAVVTHQVRDTRVRIDHHLVGQPGDTVVVQGF